MEVINKRTITIDLQLSVTTILPQFIQYDTNVLEFLVKNNGADADLSNIERITVNYKRPDGMVISRLLTAVGNVVAYEFGTEEMAVPGYGELNLSFFEADDRVTTKRIKVYFAASIGPLFEKSAGYPLLQELFIEVMDVSEAATTAGDYAAAQGEFANEKATLAQQATTNATNAASSANQEATSANNAASSANQAATSATNAASAANQAATSANTAAGYANSQGNLVGQKLDQLKNFNYEIMTLGKFSIQYNTADNSLEFIYTGV